MIEYVNKNEMKVDNSHFHHHIVKYGANSSNNIKVELNNNNV